MNKDHKNILSNVNGLHKRAALLTGIFTGFSLLCIVVFVLITPSFVSGISAVDELTWGKQFNYYVRIQDWEGLYEKANQVINKVNDLAGAHYMAGIAAEHLGNLDSAVEHYRNAVKYSPGNAVYYYSCANALFADNKLEESEKYFLDSYDMASGELRYGYDFQLGRLYYKEENYTEAEKYFVRALGFNPNEMELYQLIGEILVLQKRYQDAINILSRGIQINKDNMKIVKLLMEAYVKDDRLQMAAGVWRKNQGEEARKLYFLIRWGHGFIREDDPETARKLFEVVLLIEKDHPAALTGIKIYENYMANLAKEQEQ